MNAQVEVIKYLIKEIVYGNYKSKLLKNLSSPKIDWKKLEFILLYNELAPFLYKLVKENSAVVPENLFNLLKNTYYTGLLKYLTLFQESLNIIKEAKTRNIAIIPLKGLSFTEQYYGKFGFRPLVDIDLLIEEENFEQGVTLLRDLGYKKYLVGATEEYWRSKQCHLEFIKSTKNNHLLVELHWALDVKRYQNNVISSLWQRIRNININGKIISVLGPEDTLFSLALHQRRFGKVLNLKYICDTGMLLKKEKLNWGYILKTASEKKMRASLYFLLYQVQFVLDKNLNKYLVKLKIPFWQRKLISKIVRRYIYSPINITHLSYIYTLCHFSLYDNVAYPIKYILNIPQEQFAKFYRLSCYAPHTKRLYRLRGIYIPYRLIKDFLMFSQNNKSSSASLAFLSKP
jgi:hypothetical protein